MLCKFIIGRYLNYLETNFGKDGVFCTNEDLMKELLRHSVCITLGLSSKSNDERVRVEADKCGDFIFEGVDYASWSQRFRQGILESCIKCLDMIFIRKKEGLL